MPEERNDKTGKEVEPMKYKLTMFAGPNVYQPCPGALIRFNSPFKGAIRASDLELYWRDLVDREESLWNQEPPDRRIPFPELSARIAALFSHDLVHGKDGENTTYEYNTADGSSWIYVRHFDPNLASSALLLAVRLCFSIFAAAAGTRPAPATPEQDQIAGLRRQLAAQLPPLQMQLLMSAAHARGIPFYPTSSKSTVWQFGQGARGRHFLPMATEQDSLTGARLARNKLMSNELVRRLGFPGVEHAVANDVDHAVRIAEGIGYPVVIKPVALGMGKGVTAAIDEQSEIAAAFRSAAAFSRGVLVERYVDGTDHRIAVFGGKYAWVGAKHPAMVTGDGRHSVAALIAQENRRRLGSHTKKQIVRDEAMDKLLAKRGLSYEHCPAAGVEIRLRTVSNIAMGGVWEELPDIHRDNVDMAEALARAFRMESFGIDFISKDIRRSWKEAPCAIIEVNGSPGFYDISQAERVLTNKIPSADAARIPSILLVGSSGRDISGLAARWASPDSGIGLAAPDRTMLGPSRRGRPTDGLQARVESLIADPRCEAIVVCADPEHILDHGLPLDRFSSAVHAADLPPEPARLIQAHSRRVRICGPGYDEALVNEEFERLMSKGRSTP